MTFIMSSYHQKNIWQSSGKREKNPNMNMKLTRWKPQKDKNRTFSRPNRPYWDSENHKQFRLLSGHGLLSFYILLLYGRAKGAKIFYRPGGRLKAIADENLVGGRWCNLRFFRGLLMRSEARQMLTHSPIESESNAPPSSHVEGLSETRNPDLFDRKRFIDIN